ncbi:hypothetical protein ESCO_000469 [Escovopsis weberi]|uniref:MARVEL domain-containing protein n=1 Tax=Escovopsis weberi TaxID=150374 RepID=A0A0M8MY62_ESCWE|nr:hypothetical protein ESCO_000469 [Escovopsis weberi]
MGVKTGLGLKAVQWFTRGIQFACAAIILGIYSFFLATLASNKLPIASSLRAVEGIAGAAALYSLIALLFLCCLAGFAVTSALAVVLDVAFIAAFIYISAANRRGAGACKGYADTPLGLGDAANLLSGDEDNVDISLPRLCTACRLQTAALITAIIAILFFILSIFLEIALVRNRRREARYGSDPNYAPGSGRPRGRFTSRDPCDKDGGEMACADFNILPEHAHPDQAPNGNPYNYDDGIYTQPRH